VGCRRGGRGVELFHVDAPRVASEVSSERRVALAAACILLILIVRLIVAATTPLSYDEAYYWMWSRNLAAGYYDHPPAIAYAIRAGTAVFGDTSFGVRIVAFAVSVAATWAVWRSAAILANDEYTGLLSALFFNVMPMIGIEALVATPDALEIGAAAFFLYALAKVSETGQGPWWIAAGIAAGFALLSKYTAFFLGLSALAWLLAVPRERHWLLSPWPYAGGIVAFAMFAPVIQWNAAHGWVSLTQQFGRIGAGGFTLRYLGEFLAGQLGLASPVIAVLGVSGLVLRTRNALLMAVIAPALLYFLWHSLRDRVQGNWLSFLYPAFSIAAAMASLHFAPRWHSRIWRSLRASAAPVAATMLAVVYGQAVSGFIPILRDPVSRLLAVGIDTVTMDLEILREQNGANAILTTGYAPTAWLTFYLPSRAPVVQLNERVRYVNEPPPPRDLFEMPMLYVTELRNDQSAELKKRFSEVTPLALIGRYRSGAELDEYQIYRVSGPLGDPYF
jgi:4-amino-4-deoxy-L-arabinose transferase-like glycosyltransferase